MGLTLRHATSAAEEIAKAVPGAEVVKAFNTVFAQVLAEGAGFGNGQKASVSSPATARAPSRPPLRWPTASASTSSTRAARRTRAISSRSAA